jgi:lipopolysaccharide/colanic/teichoic acid biosynthesis glycosyltransferase
VTHAACDPWKRLIDVVVSAVGLVLSLPLQIVIATLVRRRLGKPVLFCQERPGRDERIFRLVKFRTMAEPDLVAGLITDEQRMTPFGSFLRSSSLDELPTLWNVLRGDMSLVGPRPLLVRYLDKYSPDQHRRHQVRPGITGLAQVSGRNAISWEDKFELDLRYVDTRSLTIDLGILVSTVSLVLKREGISDGQGRTMTEFEGRPFNQVSRPGLRELTAR